MMALTSRQKDMLNTMGISLWNTRRDVPELNASNSRSENSGVVEEQATLPVSISKASAESTEQQAQSVAVHWQLLQEKVKSCQDCKLHLSRTNTVFGVGDENADWMIIGEAPGADEDKHGEPFVGKAGQLLNQIFISLGLNRNTVFIANILKCRPPNNRDPHADEVVSCEPFLAQQIDHIKPKIILAIGRVAAQNLLNTKETIGRLRGQSFTYKDTDIPIVATYHPAYLLRSPLEKRKVWQDLVRAKKIMASSE